MLSKISQVSTSVGEIIPQDIAAEGGFTENSSVNIGFSNNQIIISKPHYKREGWEEDFAKYVNEGEDANMLPDNLDSEAVDI